MAESFVSLLFEGIIVLLGLEALLELVTFPLVILLVLLVVFLLV